MAAFVVGWIGVVEDDRMTLAALSIACSILHFVAVVLALLLRP